MRRSCSSLLPSCIPSRSSHFTLDSSAPILAILLTCLLLCASPLVAQQAPELVTQAVDNSIRTVLPGNVHPLARAQNDLGEAPSDLALHRMLLVLKRSPQQETVLRGLIDDQQDKHSASYHQWLAPEEFGARFGIADSDLAAVTNWLTASGFQVTQVNKGRTIVEFSGTASLVKQYFGTAIHQYGVKGEKYWANSSNPSIPTALTPVVQGFASLNNFPRQAYHTVSGPLTDNYHGGDGPLPLFTFSFNGTEHYGVGPSDFATIYNVQPLWTAGIDGTGQTIAIVGETNINIQDIRDFRSMFGLPAKDPQIMVEGPDPGILQDGEETEAVADVSWSGAVAKNATIDFVVSESTETTSGIDLSAIYIIDQNLAPVMSESYGFCEAGLGGYNGFYYYLWEQAAAQGISVMISAGDAGSAGCDNFDTESVSQFGLAVSGYASTPFNVAVGGTDFDQTPSTASTYWSSTNATGTGESAKSYVREMTWNDSCAAFGLTGCTPGNSDFFDIVGGSGGQSSCAFQDSTGTICTGGYAKPSWQTGTGVPNDGVRDLPDVSLFAGDGENGSFYILCQSDQVSPCSLNPVSFVSVGG
ncbi:MAG: protease pro-enzyme activation domain-containing protein, partial [Terriglobales bacterium]